MHTLPPALRPVSPMSTFSALFALALTATLPGCGGDDDAVATPSPVPVAPGPAVSTTVAGSVVKGPVAAAAVCAYTVVASGRGTALGSCTTTDVLGRYSLTVPAGSGLLWVEATGGTYTDEATGATITLPPGSPLRSLTTATGGTVSSTLTPLTTLALNDALARLASSGTLDGAAFAAAATRLLATFGLPADLALATATPTFGAGIDSYGTALTVISRMVAAGTPLATLLATTDPATLAAAYAAAAAPTPPVSTPPSPPATGGDPSASGTLVIGGTLPAGSASSFTPDGTAFVVSVNEGGTTYTFTKSISTAADYARLTVSVPGIGQTTVDYTDRNGGRFRSEYCTASCGVTVSTPAGATHPVTVTLAGTPVGTRTLSGSLVGDAPGALFSPGELPSTTASALTLGGSSVSAVTASDATSTTGTFTVRTLVIRLSDGSQLSLNQLNGDPVSVVRVLAPATVASCSSACNITLASNATGTRVSFASTPLSGGLVVNGTVDVGQTSGTVTTTELGSITPITSSITSDNDVRTLTFSVLGTPAQAGLSLITVQVKGGRVIKADATVGIAAELYGCLDNGASIGYPACTHVTVAADGRTLSFNNAVLYGGAVGAVKRNVTFNGTLVAKGL
ncbi:MAG: hypothetical protein Q7U99_05890 [Rubrivivax sp.]|nr:hypothetical protein [Rubrivivax sp.]